MLRVEIKLIPFGFKDLEKTLGVVEIINDGTGDLRVGNYDVLLSDEGMFTTDGESRLLSSARLEGFKRMKAGPYQILLAALLAALPPEERQPPA